MSRPDWKISSYCASGGCVAVAYVRATACGDGACVEVGRDGDRVLVRDSKDPGGPVLAFDPPVWAAFLAAVKAGDLDGAL